MSPAGGKRGKKAAEAAPQLPRRALPKDVEDKLISVYTTSAREAKYRLRSGVGKVPCLIAFWYVGKERTYRRTDVKVWLVEPSTPKGQALSAAFCTVDVMLHAQLRVAVLFDDEHLVVLLDELLHLGAEREGADAQRVEGDAVGGQHRLVRG